MTRKFNLIRKTFSNHGAVAAMNLIGFSLINKIVSFKKVEILMLTSVRADVLSVDPSFNHGFLNGDHLKILSIDRINELPESFLNEALLKNDECYAVTENDQLASFGWYSNRDTKTDIHNLSFCFDPSYMYMYKGFTKSNYRGKRLHAVGMGHALNEYLKKGYHGIVSYVEANNFDSLKSCYRMGYRKCGSIFIVKMMGHVFRFSTPAVKSLYVSFR